jgi:hypothetical protein
LLVKKLYKNQWSAFRKLDYTGDYPFNDMQAMQAMYCTGFSVVEWLLDIGGKERLYAFIHDPRPPTKKFSDHYEMNLIVAEQRWIDWMLPRGTACSDCKCYIHERDYTTTAKPSFVEGKPTLYAVGNALCLACIPYVNDYRRDRQFRAALQSRVNVVPIDGMQHIGWLRGLGITGWPAYVLKKDGQYFVVAANYPGKVELVAALDRAIAQSTPSVIATLAVKESTSPGPNDAIVVNPERKTKVVEKEAVVATDAGGLFSFEDVSWGGVAVGVLGAFGVVVPVWGVWAWRAARVAKRLRWQLHNRHRGTQAQTADSGLEKPGDSVNVGENAGARYPGAATTSHYVVDAPQRNTHRVNTQFVNVESDNYRDAHSQARVETARRYPGSQEILETELSLINQFLAGQYPAK